MSRAVLRRVRRLRKDRRSRFVKAARLYGFCPNCTNPAHIELRLRKPVTISLRSETVYMP